MNEFYVLQSKPCLFNQTSDHLEFLLFHILQPVSYRSSRSTTWEHFKDRIVTVVISSIVSGLPASESAGQFYNQVAVGNPAGIICFRRSERSLNKVTAGTLPAVLLLSRRQWNPSIWTGFSNAAGH